MKLSQFIEFKKKQFCPTGYMKVFDSSSFWLNYDQINKKLVLSIHNPEKFKEDAEYIIDMPFQLKCLIKDLQEIEKDFMDYPWHSSVR